jgi:hypothetical protein
VNDILIQLDRWLLNVTAVQELVQRAAMACWPAEDETTKARPRYRAAPSASLAGSFK